MPPVDIARPPIDFGPLAQSPSFQAARAIEHAHRRLRGNAGLLGPAQAPVKPCPDGIGYFRHYLHGSIYFSPGTGAQEVHGAIRDKWSSMGWERSLLGYPVTDESPTPDGIGRFNHFQGGSIYWTPDTGAHEVHGAIRDRWAQLGWERSFLGYPISDEMTFNDGGRVSAFEHGQIYWWPETGAIELRGVLVRYSGLVCYGEQRNDGLSASDEPYVVIGTNAADSQLAFRSRIYEGVDGGESRADSIEVYRGIPGGLALSAMVMEHDTGDPDTYKAAMQAGVSAAAAGLTVLVGIIPVVGPIIAGPVGAVLSAVSPPVADALNAVLGTEDDTVGKTTIALSPKQMVVLAGRTAPSSERGVAFKVATPLLSADGASYKAFFDVVAA